MIKINPGLVFLVGAVGLGGALIYKADIDNNDPSDRNVITDIVSSLSPSRSQTRQEVRSIAEGIVSGLDDSSFVDGIDLVAYLETNYKWDAVNLQDAGTISIGIIQYNAKYGPLASLLQTFESSNPQKFNEIFAEYAIDVTDASKLQTLDLRSDRLLGMLKQSMIFFKKEQIEGAYRWYYLERMGPAFERGFSKPTLVFALQLTILFGTNKTNTWFRQANSPTGLYNLVAAEYPQYKKRLDMAMAFLDKNGMSRDG